MTQTAVATAVYPGIEEYFADFLASLRQQTDQDFILLIANDGLQSLPILLDGYEGRTCIVQAKGTPGSVRISMIEAVIENGFEKVVFLDADDRMANNRVEHVKDVLEYEALVFNELIAFGDGVERAGGLLSQHFQNGCRYGPEELKERNFLGMSNTAVATHVLRGLCGRIDSDLLAFDWALFSVLLMQGGNAVYTDRTWTEYRQHDSNVAGLYDLSDETIRAHVEIKAAHYKFMETLDASFKECAEQYSAIFTRFDADDSFAQVYCTAVRAQKFKRSPLWWEAIKTCKELSL